MISSSRRIQHPLLSPAGRPSKASQPDPESPEAKEGGGAPFKFPGPLDPGLGPRRRTTGTCPLTSSGRTDDGACVDDFSCSAGGEASDDDAMRRRNGSFDSSSSGSSDSSSRLPEPDLNLHDCAPLERRRSSFFPPAHPLQSTVVFADLEGYSKGSDRRQRTLVRDFLSTLRELLTFAYGRPPRRGDVDDYVILPTGDGAAVIVLRPPRRVLGRRQEAGSGDDAWNGGNKHPLPSGITCPLCTRRSLRTTEETTLWIGAALLLWSDASSVGLRVGLNSGELSLVEDPYGDPNVCGDAINMAARIMDTAAPGQILASASTVAPGLNMLLAEDLAEEDLSSLNVDDSCCHDDFEDENDNYENSDRSNSNNIKGRQDCHLCPRIRYEIAAEVSEVVVKHGVTTHVQSVTCTLRPLPRLATAVSNLEDANGMNHTSHANHAIIAHARTTVGNHRTPATKWYMKIKPTEMQMQTSDDGDRIKAKVLPRELMRRHKSIAFLGIAHDTLAKGFRDVLSEDPNRRWEKIYVLFPDDDCLRNDLAKNYGDRPHPSDWVQRKRETRRELERLLTPVADDLRFLEYDRPLHCGSYWDWADPGGFIHVSPLTWGAHPKTCPAMNYYWISREPSPEYRVYRDGLEYLLGTAAEFDEEEGGEEGAPC